MLIDVWHIKGEGFHFGRHGLGQEESGVSFPSDSLFAALVARMAALYGAEVVDQFVRPFAKSSPPFVLTSAFPRAKDVLFFPPPKHHPSDTASTQEDGPRPKQLKRVAYVSKAVFGDILKGETLERLWGSSVKLHDKQVLLTQREFDQLPGFLQKEGQRLWKVERRPHAALGRTTTNSQIYHTGRTVFNQDCGLWFGVRWFEKKPALNTRLKTVFQELGDAGLGGERSRGYGQSEIAEQDQQLTLSDPDSEASWLTLSRYLPRNQEETAQALDDPRASYSLETVRGWVNSPSHGKAQRRRTINVLAEGSVFGPVETDAPGQMVDVRPHYDNQDHLDHPVWRNGFALAVGFTKEIAA